MNVKVANPAWILYSALVLLACGWLVAVVAAPKLMCNGSEWVALILYRTFALVCHQRNERSFHWCGWPLAVCVRCTGIYLGALLGLLLYPFCYRPDNASVPAKRYLLLASTLLALDWVLGVAGVFRQNPGTRLVTGLMAGAVIAFYVFPALRLALLPSASSRTEVT
ncbi:MAG: DUF2085 domain-containing protein [Acidobacteria bacterium]|nr:DUF2085 domain-containing protein [Acidobacteriota bacterium]MBI3422417.1 DUF2085 domain-containing protein [Acidobacteriota bacterium]